MNRHFILRIESYDGRDTHIWCGDDERDFIYVVGCLDEYGHAEVVDCGYRSLEEAAQAGPEALPRPTPSTKPKDRSKGRRRA